MPPRYVFWQIGTLALFAGHRPGRMSLTRHQSCRMKGVPMLTDVAVTMHRYWIVVARSWLWWLAILLLVGCGGEETAVIATPTLSPQATHGQQLFTRECGACHSFSPDTVIVGPSLAGIANRAGSRVAGQDAQTYILTAILRPGDYLVEGFDNLMPTTFGKQLTGEDIDALVAYLLEAG